MGCDDFKNNGLVNLSHPKQYAQNGLRYKGEGGGVGKYPNYR